MNHIINIYVTKCFKQNTEKKSAHGKIYSLTHQHCKSIYILVQVFYIVIINIIFSSNQTHYAVQFKWQNGNKQIFR